MERKGKERKGTKRKGQERKGKKRTESKGGMGDCWRGRGIVIGKKGKREGKNKSEVGSGKRGEICQLLDRDQDLKTRQNL